MSFVLKSTTESIVRVFWIIYNSVIQLFQKALSAILPTNTIKKLTRDNSNTGYNSQTNAKLTGLSLKSITKIPGPLTVPWFGTIWTTPHKTDLVKLNEYLVQNYGTIVKLEYFGNYPIINLFDAEDIYYAVKHAVAFRPAAEILKLYRNSRKDRYGILGIAHTNGQDWMSIRTLVEPQLCNTMYNRKLYPTCVTIADDLVKLLMPLTNQAIPAFDQYLFRFNMECACSLILGTRLNVLHPESTHKMNVFIAACEPYFNSLAESFTGFPWFSYFSDKVWKNFVQSEETIYEIFSEVVEELQISGELNGLLEHFFDAKSEVSFDDRKTLAMDLILGALEPVHNSVVFTLYLISKHPDVEQKVFTELKNVLPYKDSILEETDIDKLSYLKACIQESYRFMPTASRLTRFVDKSISLQGYEIPSYTLLMCQSWYASMQDVNFYQAKHFLPERWILREMDGKRTPPFTPHSPKLMHNFGIGKRDCPGRKFVQVEILALLAKIYRNFKLEFPNELDTTYQYLLTPVFPISVVLTPRNN